MNAVITGGTKGIGRAIADLLASKGIDLYICSRSTSDLEKMKSAIETQHGVSVYTAVVDMSDKNAVKGFAADILNEVEQVDAEEEDGALEKMINTNLYSAYHLSRALLPGMISNGHGHIFNMCSIASKIAYPNGGSYSISKFALLGFSKVLREELKEKGIKVTSILPGATWSNSWAGVDLPKDRLMEAEDIAIAVWGALQMSPSAVMEEIILRPQLGDL